MKAELLEIVRIELKSQLDRLSQAAREAHAAATDPDSKAEGKYDTRSLEASYLATGQAKQVEELAQAIRVFDGFCPPDFDMEDPIGMGALVEIDRKGESSRLLLAPAAGGLVVTMDGEDVTLLTPSSALYRGLVDRKAGDFIEDLDLVILEVF